MEQVTASRNDLDVRFQAELAVGGGSAQQRAGRTVRLKEVTREPMRGRRKGTPPRGAARARRRNMQASYLSLPASTTPTPNLSSLRMSTTYLPVP